MGSFTLCTLLAGICLSTNLLRCVELFPLPTTTESPHILAAISSDAVTETTMEPPTSEIPDQSVQPSSNPNSPGSLASHMLAILTTMFNQQPTSTTSDEANEVHYLPVSSSVVSSSTTIHSEENCSSEAVQAGPCRKRSPSTDELADVVFSYMTRHVKRNLRESNPSASSSDLDEQTTTDDENSESESSDDSSQQRDDSEHDSDSNSSSDKNEPSSSFVDSSSTSTTSSTEPTISI